MIFFLICLNKIIIFYLQMESSFGKDFAIVAKLALIGSSATSRPYKKGGEGLIFSHISTKRHPPPEPPLP